MTLYRGWYRIESTRLRAWDYRSRGWYFVTICTHGRARIFGQIIDAQVKLSPVGLIARSELETLHKHYENVVVDEHVVMPNHIHAIIMIDGEHCFSPDRKPKLTRSHIESAFTSPEAGSLSVIVRSYKAGVTLRCHELGLTQEIWQSRFHDHLLRGDKVISAVREYIRNNPANWSLDLGERCWATYLRAKFDEPQTGVLVAGETLQATSLRPILGLWRRNRTFSSGLRRNDRCA